MPDLPDVLWAWIIVGGSLGALVVLGGADDARRRVWTRLRRRRGRRTP